MNISKQEVLSIIISQPKYYLQEKIFSKKFPKLYQEIQSINFPEDFKWTQKLYHFFNDDFEFNLGRCVMCGKRCNFQTFGKGYSIYCSKECCMNDSKRIEKMQNTCLKKYGVKNVTQSPEIRKKMEDSLYKKYGVRNPMKSKEIQEKTKQTNNIRYGCDTPLQNKEVKNKIKETCLKRYGCENPMQSEKIKEKHQQTCLERYGEKNVSQLEFVKEKVKETCQEKYGEDSYSKTNECKEKIKETCRQRFGFDNAMQSEKIKEKHQQTCLERYGETAYTKTDDFKEKYKETCQEKYNADSFPQSSEFIKYRRKRVEYDGLTFDSTWEVKIYQYCKEHYIPCEYQPSITFEYTFEGKKHYYHPDFLINGKLYEVKGDQFFDENGKMINPYDKENDLFEAKHQCMLQNGVIILRGNDIKNLDKIEF